MWFEFFDDRFFLAGASETFHAVLSCYDDPVQIAPNAPFWRGVSKVKRDESLSFSSCSLSVKMKPADKTKDQATAWENRHTELDRKAERNDTLFKWCDYFELIPEYENDQEERKSEAAKLSSFSLWTEQKKTVDQSVQLLCYNTAVIISPLYSHGYRAVNWCVSMTYACNRRIVQTFHLRNRLSTILDVQINIIGPQFQLPVLGRLKSKGFCTVN